MDFCTLTDVKRKPLLIYVCNLFSDHLSLFHFIGTRIIYERKFLLELRNSPLSRTPPRNLPLIPGVTCDEKVKPESPLKDNGVVTTEPENDKNDHGKKLSWMYLVVREEFYALHEASFRILTLANCKKIKFIFCQISRNKYAVFI